MKKKELNTIRAKKIEDLSREASELKSKIEKTKMDMQVSKEKNLKKVKNLVHDLSQILTIIREKQLMEANKNEKGKEDEK